MPSRQLLTRFQEHLSVVDHQWWDGTHYQRTAEAWLENLSANRASLIDVFARSYGRSESGHWYRRWKMFYLACSELWGFRGGTEWGVGHYVFEAGAGQRRKSAAVNWDLAC